MAKRKLSVTITGDAAAFGRLSRRQRFWRRMLRRLR